MEPEIQRAFEGAGGRGGSTKRGDGHTRRRRFGGLDDEISWSPYDHAGRPRRIAMTAFGFALAILAAVAVCAYGSYLIALDLWSIVIDLLTSAG